MPMPLPKNDFIYGKKPFPSMYFPAHKNDFRYNFLIQSWPRRHFVPDMKAKMYNFSDFDEVMHGNQWNDFDLDYQLESPMESNHYIANRSPLFLMLSLAFIGFFAISKD